MKIDRVEVKNFKSIKSAEFNLNNGVTTIVGKNNAGKSNLTEVFLFLNKLALTENGEIDEVFKEYGGFGEIVYNKSNRSPIKISLEMTLNSTDFNDIGLNFDSLQDESSMKAIYSLEATAKTQPFGRVSVSSSENLSIVINQKKVDLATSVIDENDRQRTTWTRSILEELENESEQNHNTSGGSPNRTILIQNPHFIPPTDGEMVARFLGSFFINISRLDPHRNAPFFASAKGVKRLGSNAENLPELLNTLASSNFDLFSRIKKSFTSIITDVNEIRAAMDVDMSDVRITLREKLVKDAFGWGQLSSGEKELLYLITFLYSTVSGSFLIIEEPELHLHWESILNVMSLIEEESAKFEKQILVVTHSPSLIDNQNMDRLLIATKKEGATEIISPIMYNGIGEILKESGGSPSLVLSYWPAKYILIVEGRDDYYIWKGFLSTLEYPKIEEKIKIINAESKSKALLMGQFLSRINVPIQWKTIIDSDGNFEESLREARKKIQSESNIHVWQKQEIEDYIANADAISAVMNVPIVKVKEAIKICPNKGKGMLKCIFSQLGSSEPSPHTKEMIARNIGFDSIEQEVRELIDEIRNKI